MGRVAALVAFAVALGALVLSVLERRAPGRFPLATLVRESFPAGRALDRYVVAGGAAGITSVLAPWVLARALGWAHVASSPWAPFFAVMPLLVATLAIKTVMAVTEELVFRGAVLSQVSRRAGALAGILTSAVVFALAHGTRDAFDVRSCVVFALDGIGLAALAVVSRGLWGPAAWHVAKNVCVWLVGGGTVQLVAGPWPTTWSGPASWLGAPGGAGWLDVLFTAIVVGVVLLVARAWTTPVTVSLRSVPPPRS